MFVPNRTIPYSRQLIEDDDIKAVAEVLKSDYLTQGPKVTEFENALAEYCDAKFAVVFSNGTAALHASYFAAGIKEGDEVIIPPITFAATGNAALYLGAKPVFVDIESGTGNINPALIEEKITHKTKAIIPVHYSGHPVNLDKIHEVAKKYNLIVIEDAAHAIGSRYKRKKIGGLSAMTELSFHPVKPITTGEGGAVLTNDENYYEKMKIFRTHGITNLHRYLNHKDEGGWYYEMQHLGFNYRLTDIQAALGISQLKKLDRFISERRKIRDFYYEAFENIDEIEITKEKEYSYSSWHLFPIRLKGKLVKDRKEIFTHLRNNKIWVQVHYIPVYFLPYYKSLGYKEGLCPAAEEFYRSEISIPIFHGMTLDEAKYVVDKLLSFI